MRATAVFGGWPVGVGPRCLCTSLIMIWLPFAGAGLPAASAMPPDKQVRWKVQDSGYGGQGVLTGFVQGSDRSSRGLKPSLSRCCPASKTTVKQRIRAIKNIGKITKAMKMVAASKMRNAQVAVEKSRGIVNPFVRLFGDHPGAFCRWHEG